MDVRTCYKLRLEDLAEANYRKRTINNIDSDFAESLLLNHEMTSNHADISFYKVGMGSSETFEAEFRAIASEAENIHSDNIQIGVYLQYGVFALLNICSDDEVLYYEEDGTHILYCKGVFISNNKIFEKSKLKFKKLKFNLGEDCNTKTIWIEKLEQITQVMGDSGEEVELVYHINPDNTMLMASTIGLFSGNFVWKLGTQPFTTCYIVSRLGYELNLNKEIPDA